jgi:hypothetical protein
MKIPVLIGYYLLVGVVHVTTGETWSPIDVDGMTQRSITQI